MNSIRKWFYRPRKDDPTLLAQFYYADEELNVVAGELDSFDGRKDPERCTALVNQLRQAQDKVLNICVEMMEDVLPDEREPRDFRVKFPDDVMQETLSGQLWFGAECLAAGSNILNREAESSRMRPLAKAVTKTIDNVRNLLREQCLKPIPDYTEKIRESLKIFDRLFADFELSYVSAMMPVKSVDEYEMQQNVIILFSDTLQRAVKLDLVSQEQIDNYDPALMFTIPRLAIVAGLVIFPDGPLNLERETKALSELFRPFKTLLLKIRELLWTMSRAELGALEKYLCSLEEPSITPHTLPKEQLMPEETFSYDGPTAFTCDFIQRFYSWHPSCRAIAPQLLGAGVAKKGDRPERKRERHATKASRTRARQERQSARFLSRLTGEEERPRTHRRSRRSGASHHACCRSERDPTASRSRHPPAPRPPRASRQEFAMACACGNRNSAHECSASASLRQMETHDAASGLAATACEDVADHLAASLQASHIVAEASLHISHVPADLPDAVSLSFFAENAARPDLDLTATDGNPNDISGDGDASSPYRSCLSATDSPRCEASAVAASECRCDDSSGAASPHHSDDEEVALALQAAEVAASLKARERFCDASDLIQRLFVCVSGVADQLQTNYASDLRHILRSVFLMNQTPEEEDEDEHSMGCKRLHDDTTSTNSSDQLSVESAEDALIVIGSPVDDDGIDDEEEEQDCEAALLGASEDGGTSPMPFGARPRSSSVVVSPSIFADHALMQYANMSPPPPNGTVEDVSFISDARVSPRTSPRASPESRDAMAPERRYSIVQEPPTWVPDQAAPRCMACGALFTVVRRRHHCRNCGKVFCGHCSRHSVPLPHFGIWRNVRVCNACFLVYVTSTADGSAALSS